MQKDVNLDKVYFKDYNKETFDEKSVATVADLRAQRIIIQELRLLYPGLVIVGEEEDDGTIPGDDDHDLYKKENISEHPFLKSNCITSSIAPKTINLPIDHVVVYIDPLDGTHEFVEARTSNVQTLIGISVYGTPLAGIMGLPFWGQCVNEKG